ncbi:MAG: N-acetylmuramoyl-L-alanine amidase [Clostridiales bacterium]|nr:N-acetylmuramoyl-L-alanine amidase [Clostridiales bacterium]
MNRYIRFFILTALFSVILCLSAFGENRYVSLYLNYDGATHYYNAEEVFLEVNGEKLTNLTMDPIIYEGYTLVPAREVFEKLGATVSWNADREEVYVAEGSDFLVLKINSKTAYYNNSETQMDIPAKLINSKTMIPARFVSETMGYGVEWDNSTRTVKISSGGSDTSSASSVTQAASSVTTTTETAAESTTEAGYSLITIGTDTAGLPNELYDLTDANHYDCKITGIYQGEDKTYIKIEADDEISRVVTGYVTDGRYYLDIYAATSDIGRVRMAASVGGISEIRAGERYEDNYNIVRIAMDTSDMEFNVSLTADRKAIYIYYPSPEITNYKQVTNESSDVFTVMGHDLEKPEITADEDTITVTFKDTELTAAEQTLKRNSLYISSTDISASGSDAVITFKLKEEAAYRTTATGATVVITIYQTDYSNLIADEGTDTITLTKKSSISLSSIKEEDDYQNLKYIITLPGNFSSDYGTGEIYFEESERLNSMSISLSGSNTVLTFNEKVVSAFVITEDKNNIYISCVDIHDKYDKIVVIDAGHGGSDSGASANGLDEKDLNLDIVLKIKSLIEADGEIKAYFTRLDDTYVSLQERSDFGNEIDCPFVSVHINSGGTSNTSANGVEVYWQYENKDENGLTSYDLAEACYNKMIEYLGANERGIKTSNLHVLREADNPATLIEVGFITNAAEASKMGTDSYRQLVAEAIYAALLEVL